MISKEDIQLVNSKMDVVDIVSNFILLKKKGANYIGNCPFHNEKTGSFTVSPSKQIYKCFGCGKSGNAITFVMESEKYSYAESVKWIATRLHIEIIDVYKSDDDKNKALESESVFIINKYANDFFKANLQSNTNALDYVKSRGISNECVNDFEIGYCGDGYDSLAKLITNNHYNLQVAISAGLCKENNGILYDIYHTRLIFPIHNLTGKIIGFGGRITVADKKRPKYINSPDTPIYHKGNTLYGLYQSKADIVKQDEAILVEGYTDVISLHQFGIRNSIASSGTALTETQIRIIRRFTKNIVLLYDGDSAGLNAIMRGIELCILDGISIRVVILPTGEDPDSFVKKYGKDFTIDYIQKNKKDFVDFYIDTQDISNPEKKDAALKDICKLIIKVGDDNHFKKQHYINKTCALFQIDLKIILKYIDSVNVAAKFKSNVAIPLEINTNNQKEYLIHQREKELTKLLLKYGSCEYVSGIYVCQKILEIVQTETDNFYMPNKLTVSIHKKYKDYLLHGEIPNINLFISDEDKDVSFFTSSVAIEDDLISLNWDDSLKSVTKNYKEQIRMSLGLYEISHLKMNIWMLHNKVDKSDPNWSIDIINSCDIELKKQLREKAAELGLSNFKL